MSINASKDLDFIKKLIPKSNFVDDLVSIDTNSVKNQNGSETHEISYTAAWCLGKSEEHLNPLTVGDLSDGPNLDLCLNISNGNSKDHIKAIATEIIPMIFSKARYYQSETGEVKNFSLDAEPFSAIIDAAINGEVDKGFWVGTFTFIEALIQGRLSDMVNKLGPVYAVGLELSFLFKDSYMDIEDVFDKETKILHGDALGDGFNIQFATCPMFTNEENKVTFFTEKERLLVPKDLRNLIWLI